MYAGPTGHNSQALIDYFESIPDVPKIVDTVNPATWMVRRLSMLTSRSCSLLAVGGVER